VLLLSVTQFAPSARQGERPYLPISLGIAHLLSLKLLLFYFTAFTVVTKVKLVTCNKLEYYKQVPIERENSREMPVLSRVGVNVICLVLEFLCDMHLQTKTPAVSLT
jgi:hypothetical protein